MMMCQVSVATFLTLVGFVRFRGQYRSTAKVYQLDLLSMRVVEDVLIFDVTVVHSL